MPAPIVSTLKELHRGVRNVRQKTTHPLPHYREMTLPREQEIKPDPYLAVILFPNATLYPLSQR